MNKAIKHTPGPWAVGEVKHLIVEWPNDAADATKGFDDPGFEVVAMARPTKSRALYCQAIGRGTRPLPGIVDGYEEVEDRIERIANAEAGG